MTTNPVIATWVTISPALPNESRQIRRSRSGCRGRRPRRPPRSGRPLDEPERRRGTRRANDSPARTSERAARPSGPRSPARSARRGTRRAARTSGESRGRSRARRRVNQLVTARPVAVFVLAPRAPPSASRRTNDANPGAYAAAASAAAAPASPSVPVVRSPMRSAASPHGRSVSTAPTLATPSRTPTCVRLRW